MGASKDGATGGGGLPASGPELRDREARQRALIAASAYATYRMNADWSEMLEAERTGDEDVQALGPSWLDHIHVEDRPLVVEAVHEAIAEKKPLQVEHRVRRRDGSLRWTLSRAVPILDEEGEIKEWFGAVTDVTLAREAAIAAQRFHAIVESSDDAIVSKDLNGIIASWNKGAERIFGYRAEEVIGKHISILIPEDRLSEEPGIVERIRRGERVDPYDTIRRRKDGSRIDISLTVSPIMLGGKVIGASKIARDISQRKQAEATQRLLLNELNHRVKNTLASVQAIAQQTLRRATDPADFASKFSGRIQSLARVHSQLTEATWQGADLRQLIRDQLLQGAVDETRLTAWGPAVRLGPQTAVHLALMLHELGTNSVKYGAFSTPDGHVSASWSVRDSELHLKWIERGGPPVAAPASRGFGTTLIEQSAKGEGGDAKMICEAEGVTWEIWLPLTGDRGGAGTWDKPARDASPSVVRDITAASPSHLSGKRILVIEDETLIALDLVDSLKRAGARVAPAIGAAAEALEAIAAGEFDAALLDANLHGSSVDEIAAALVRRGVPFVFVTGYGKAGLPEAFQHMAVVPKPFDERQLLDAVSAVLAAPASIAKTSRIRH